MIGDVGQRHLGDQLDRQLDGVTLDRGVALEHSTEVLDAVQPDRTDLQLVEVDGPREHQAGRERVIGLAFGEIDQATGHVDLGLGRRCGGQRQFARDMGIAHVLDDLPR